MEILHNHNDVLGTRPTDYGRGHQINLNSQSHYGYYRFRVHKPQINNVYSELSSDQLHLRVPPTLTK